MNGGPSLEEQASCGGATPSADVRGGHFFSRPLIHSLSHADLRRPLPSGEEEEDDREGSGGYFHKLRWKSPELVKCLLLFMSMILRGYIYI